MVWRYLPARIPRWAALLVLVSPRLAIADAVEGPTNASAIASLRAELAALERDYESRLAVLEARLAALESTPPKVAPAATGSPATPMASGVIPGREFNPAIGVIFQGQAWHTRRDPEAIPGFPLGGEAGPPPEGLAIGETEIDISANVDDLFTAWLTVPIVVEDGETAIEVEEAWIETLRMPAGLSARFGRFFSGIGYLNGRHSHTWDFVDQPLAYQAFLGNQYLDDGIQLRWIAPTDLYLEVGAELLRGDRYPAAGAANGGAGARTLFAHIGGDVGASHGWRAGLSYLRSESRDRPAADDTLLFTGDSDLVIADFVWKWAPQGNWRAQNLIVQGEYLWRSEEGNYLLPDGREPGIDWSQRGWYVQAAYQPFPQWRFGARVEGLSSGDPGSEFGGTALDPAGGDPERYTVMVDYSHSEFSRLRLQYGRDLSGLTSNDVWGLQYIQSIGAHGAHSF